MKCLNFEILIGKEEHDEKYVKILLLFLICSIVVSAVRTTKTAALEDSSGYYNKENTLYEENNQEIMSDLCEPGSGSFCVSQEEDLNSYVFQNPDGSRTAYIFSEDIKYIDENGQAVEKDLTIVKTDGGYTTRENNVTVYFPAELGKAPVSVSYDGAKLSIVPKNLQGSEPLKAVCSENFIDYQDAFGGGITLRYTPTLSGVKEDIILESFTGIGEFKFVIETNGLTEDEGGYISERGDRFDFGEIYVYDAAGNFTIGSLNLEKNGIAKITCPEEFLTASATVYPVTVDPGINITIDAAESTAYIEDTTIYEGKPSLVTGTWQFNHAGYISDYGKGRVLVKIPGLSLNSAYNSISASQINSASFVICDAGGTAPQQVDLYAYNGLAWSESTANWNNTSPNGYTTIIDSQSPSYGNDSTYDITDLVKGWKDGTYNQALGFMLKAVNETDGSKVKALCASEYTTKQPYVIINYTPNIYISPCAPAVCEGSSFSLIAITVPSGLTVNWSSSDTDAAQISGTGYVTALKAKATPVTITAAVTDSGNTYSASCQFYVKVPDGVYYIKNLNTDYYLHVESGSISGLPNVSQHEKYADGVSDLYRIRQMWKIRYLENGIYSIRPMFKLDMGLDVSGNNVDVYNIGTTDSLEGVPSFARWTIERSTTGYFLKNNGSAGLTLQGDDISGNFRENVYAGTLTNETRCRWALEIISTPPAGIVLYNASTGLPITNPTEFIAPEEVKTISGLRLAVAVYSGDSIDQTVTWLSGNSRIAAVNSGTGAVTGVSGGTTTIWAFRVINGENKNVGYAVNVTEIPNGTYFIENKRTEKYADIENRTMSAGTQAVQWDFTGDEAGRWIFTHQGDGYYTIKSANSETAYYLGVSGDQTGNDVPVVLRTGTITNGMKWKVTATASGAYKITPKTGEANDRVLAVGWYLINSNGVDIEQRDYVEDGNYKDEWKLYRTDGKTVMLVAIKDIDDRDRVTEYDEVFGYLNDYGYSDFNFVYTEYFSAADCLNQMAEASIFVSRSHGTSDSNETILKLYRDGECNSRLYSTDIYNGSALVDLSSLELAIFAGCNTAQNTDTGRNLVDASVNAGAGCAIGFNDTVDCYDANEWVERFFYYHYYLGLNVTVSCDSASIDVSGIYGKYYIDN